MQLIFMYIYIHYLHHYSKSKHEKAATWLMTEQTCYLLQLLPNESSHHAKLVSSKQDVLGVIY